MTETLETDIVAAYIDAQDAIQGVLGGVEPKIREPAPDRIGDAEVEDAPVRG